MKKLGIVGGAGGLGSTMAFYLGLRGFFEEISLVDVKANILGTHLIDLTECFSEETPTRVAGGGWEALAGCDLVIMAASITGAQVQSRNEYLAANIKLVRETAARLKEFCPQATVITATAPVDVFNMVFQAETGWDKHRFLGFNRNDSQRFRWAVSEVLKIDGRRVGGLVLGEHGETQVPIFSTVTIDGHPAELAASRKLAVEKILREWYGHWQSLDSGRTTTWTSATSISHMIKSMLTAPSKVVPPCLQDEAYVEAEEGRAYNMDRLPPIDPRRRHAPPKFPGGSDWSPEEGRSERQAEAGDTTVASVIVDGEYGLSDVSLGLPVQVGPGGWQRVLEISLTDREREALAASAERIRELYRLCG